MNRKIKFRAWLKDEEKMVEVKAIDFDENGDVFSINYPEGKSYSGYDKDDIELMPYTGLKCKNGVDIYEGDIIKIWGKTFDGKMKFDIGVIIYSEGMSCFGIKLKNINIHLYQYMQNDYEVIGNIYENTELLEESDE